MWPFIVDRLFDKIKVRSSAYNHDDKGNVPEVYERYKAMIRHREYTEELPTNCHRCGCTLKEPKKIKVGRYDYKTGAVKEVEYRLKCNNLLCTYSGFVVFDQQKPFNNQYFRTVLGLYHM